MFGYDPKARCRAHKAIVRPLLEYACVVWSPCLKDVNLLEAVQRRAARWVCGSHWDLTICSWTIPHDTCYQQLHLPTCVIIYQSVVFRAFVTMVSFLFRIIVYTTLCHCIAILFVLYLHCQKSMLGVIFTLCAFVLSGTRFPLTYLELKIAIPFAMRPINISVVSSKP